MTPYHTPVLLEEILDGLALEPGMRVVDATLGGGGYSRAFVQKGAYVLSIDADPDAISYIQKIWEQDDMMRDRRGHWHVEHGNFRNIYDIVRNYGWNEIDGAVFDLGVSSFQLDTPQRGFSYRFADAPLDMRFDATGQMTAQTIINTASEGELYEIFATFGEEDSAGAIAHALVGARAVKPIQTVGDLRAVIGAASSQSPRVLSRVFQALRMAANDEREALKEGLIGAEKLLKSGGKLAIVSFHSLEDRAVKQFMSRTMRTRTKKPITPSDTEQRQNARARSAKLRIGIKT